MWQWVARGISLHFLIAQMEQHSPFRLTLFRLGMYVGVCVCDLPYICVCSVSIVFSAEAALQLGYCSLFNPGEGEREEDEYWCWGEGSP